MYVQKERFAVCSTTGGKCHSQNQLTSLTSWLHQSQTPLSQSRVFGVSGRFVQVAAVSIIFAVEAIAAASNARTAVVAVEQVRLVVSLLELV